MRDSLREKEAAQAAFLLGTTADGNDLARLHDQIDRQVTERLFLLPVVDLELLGAKAEALGRAW